AEHLVAEARACGAAREHEATEARGRPRRRDQRDGTAHAAAEQDAGAEPERVEHAEDDRRAVLDRRRAVDPARAPVPGEVDGYDAVLRAEPGELPPPDAGVAARGVQEHEERAAVERGRNVGQGRRT